MIMVVEAERRFLEADWLEGVDLDLRRVLFDHLREDHVSAGTVVICQGQPNDLLSFVLEGRFLVWRDHGSGVSDVTTAAHIHSDPAQLVFDAPAVFGETSFYTGQPAIVSVRAETDLWRLVMDRQAHEQLRSDHPRAAEALAFSSARTLSHQFADIENQLDRFLGLTYMSSPRKSETEWSRFRKQLF